MKFSKLADRWIQFKIVFVSGKKTTKFSKKPVAVCESLGADLVLVYEKPLCQAELFGGWDKEVNIMSYVRKRVERFYRNEMDPVFGKDISHLIVQIEGLSDVFLSVIDDITRNKEEVCRASQNLVLLDELQHPLLVFDLHSPVLQQGSGKYYRFGFPSGGF